MRRLSHGIAVVLALTGCMPPSWGANILLHPGRKPLTTTTSVPHEDVTFSGDDGVLLKGWLFRATAPRKGLLVYLHGMGDNRAGGIGFAQRFAPKGWDVLAYDSRAQGESGGAFESYGVLEKRDLSRALDAVKADSAILFGSSLGGSVALQAAAQDARVKAVIAQSPFADLRTVAMERAPFFASKSEIEEAFKLAQAEAHYSVDDASPIKFAANIHVPVLLIHGGEDHETPTEHSRRLFAALSEPKQLIIVDGAGHNDTLKGDAIWRTIEEWIAARKL